MDETLTLCASGWNLVVAPADGGSLLSCDFDGLRVLHAAERPALIGRASSRSCYFPLIPFSNRVEQSRFQFQDVPVALATNVVDSPHAMHGHGWLAPWDVAERSETHCSLTFEHVAGDRWPWRYRGRQTFTIADDQLTIALEIVNLAATPMPCGLGFHPFFPADDAPRLRLQAGSVWDGGAAAFPRTRVAVPDRLDFSSAPRVADRAGIDHCFERWQGRASVTYEDTLFRIILSSCAAAGSVIVYIPENARYFCVEPVTHAVNAMNLADPAAAGLWTLEPHASRQITMSLRCAVLG